MESAQPQSSPGLGPSARGRTRTPGRALERRKGTQHGKPDLNPELLLTRHHRTAAEPLGLLLLSSTRSHNPTGLKPPKVSKDPPGPPAVAETGLKGCSFKNVINQDLQCPEEHLQAGK